jgi:hypothetical protein
MRDRASTSRKTRTRSSRLSMRSLQYWSIGLPSTCSRTRYGYPPCETPASISSAIWRDVQKLHRDAALEPAVAAFGQPDATHPTSAEGRHKGVGADRLAGEPGLNRPQRPILLQELLQKAGDGWIPFVQRRQPTAAFLVRQGKRHIQIGLATCHLSLGVDIGSFRTTHPR